MADAPKVYKAIVAITKALSIGGISKDNKNTQQGYKFRGIDDVYNHLSGLLAANDLCIFPQVLSRSVLERQTKNGGNLFFVTVEVAYDLVSSIDGSKHTIKTFGEAMDSADKATNKAMSAAYKYACIQTFCIPTEGDNDADATTHEVASDGVSQSADAEFVVDASNIISSAIAIIMQATSKQDLAGTWEAIEWAKIPDNRRGELMKAKDDRIKSLGAATTVDAKTSLDNLSEGFPGDLTN